MADVSAAMVKELREKTGAGMMDCKKALAESEGDFAKAEEYLRKKGMSGAAKKQGRIAAEGLVGTYVHGGRIGVLVEVNCETDFVARTDAFRTLAHDVALQVASMNPQYVDESEIPEGTEGSKAGLALLSQPFIRDPKRTIAELVTEVSRTTGEV